MGHEIHTPGPWKIGYYRPKDKEQALAVWQDSIKENEKGYPICLVSPVDKANGRDEANARLIAAAPELLAALETLDQIERGQVGWHKDAKPEAWAKARSAIAKAKRQRRMAFFVLETRVNTQGEYIALIAVEGEPGFNQTDWYWGKDLQVARDIVNERNARLGLSPVDAAKIVASTFTAVKLPTTELEEPEDNTGDVCPCGDPDCSRPFGHEEVSHE